MKIAQTTCTPAHAQNICKVKKANKLYIRGIELTKCTMVDVPVDRRVDRPILIVSFYYYVERQPC